MFRIANGNQSIPCEGITCTDPFLERPGNGQPYVYSPVNVNITLHCAVINTLSLVWEVDGLALDSQGQRQVLQSRRIFQNGPIDTSGVRKSNVTVFGDSELNNNIRICCQSLINLNIEETCVTLILYGKITVTVIHFL